MEFNRLEQNKRNKIIIGIILLVLLLITIILVTSESKYQVTSKVQIVKGKVSYQPYDFKIVKIYQENDTGNYDEVDKVPTDGYEINEKDSKCMIDDNTKDTGAILKTINGNHTFANLKKMDKCTLYFSKEKTPSEKVIDKLELTINSTTEGCPAEINPTINNIYSGKGLLCKGEDDYGDTYYFRGNVQNNWVKMGSIYWKIIRINGDGTIRLIYNGAYASQTGGTTQYATGPFNLGNENNAYVGLKYSSNIRNGHDSASTLIGTLNKFYSDYFVSSKPLASYTDKLDHNAGFCGDRTSTTNSSATSTNNSGGTGTTTTYYGGYIRLYNSKKPTFKCPEPNTDLYTTNSAARGNNALDNPIGLITSDEAMYAGGFNINNNSYWLYTGQHYWTMSPYYFGGIAGVFFVDSTGELRYNYVYNSNIGVRPVINLKTDTEIEFQDPDGENKGTTSNPYIVK